MISIQQTIRRLREARNLSTEDASKLVYVSRRTIELWERRERDIPDAKLELYLSKLLGDYKSTEELIVIIEDGGVTLNLPIPRDVISEDTFLSISDDGYGNATIASMFVDRETRKPSVLRTRFLVEPHNSRALATALRWQKKIEAELCRDV